MKLRIAVLTIVALGCFMVFHLSGQSSRGTAEAAATTDPCAGTLLKSSAAITGTAADIVPAVSGEVVYVCGFALTSPAQAATTGQFGSESGPTECGPTATPLTGDMGNIVVAGNNKQTLFATQRGNYLCFAGSSTGFVTYVQK
jgi:hypothetical protein